MAVYRAAYRPLFKYFDMPNILQTVLDASPLL